MGAHSAMPVYPAAMSTLAQPMLPPGRWHAAKVTAGVLCFVAVVLVVASSFLPLYSGELSFGGQSVELTITPWHADFSPDSASSDAAGDVPKVGYPMVFAAVVLACAAAACWYAATPTARPAARHAAGVTTTVASAFLIGTAWTTALLVSNGVDYVILLGTLNQGLETDATYLVGYWLLLTASVLAFTAAILSLIPARRPYWQPPMMMNAQVPTPSYGIALPMDALPQTPPPGHVNPLTGHLVHIDPLTGQPAPYPSSGPPPAAQAPVQGGYPLAQGPASPAGGTPLAPGAPGAVDPLTGHPMSPPSGLPFHQGPIGVDPVTGQQVSQGQPAGAPFAQGAIVPPVAGQGQPVSHGPSAGIPTTRGAAVDPVTGQPVSQGLSAGVPGVVVDPLTGLPVVPGAVPAAGPVSAPVAADTPGAQPIAPVPSAQPAPFPAKPGGQVDSTPAAPVAEPAPVVVPDAPPLPETPPGPAIPANEDPLAEPPRT